MIKEKQKSGRPRKYPFDKLLVGDSLVIDIEVYSKEYHQYVSSLVGSYKRTTNKMFTTRRGLDEDGIDRVIVIRLR